MEFKRVVQLDTNCLIQNPRAIYDFPDDLVVLSSIVIGELDHLKDSKDGSVRRQARATSWLLDYITEENEGRSVMKMENGGYLKIEHGFQTEFECYEPNKADNRIISVAVGYAKSGEYEEVVLYSLDVNCRVLTRNIATELNIPLKAKRYLTVDKSLHDIETGVEELYFSPEKIEYARKRGYIEIDLPYLNGEHIMLMNEMNPKATLLGQYDSIMGRIDILPDYKKGEPLWLIGGGKEGSTPVRPIDSRQSFMAHDILNPEKHLHFVLSRVAGAGKNFIALACSLKMLKQGLYDRLIVIKPMHAVDGEETGFLPGSKAEKIAPWFESFNDTMYELTNGRFESGEFSELGARIELEIVTHMRGRSIPNTIIIIDEAQNLSESALKTLLTRAGENTKIIIMGDLSQIDNPRLDSSNCGLRVWAHRSRDKETGYRHSSYVLLDSNFRSELSAWASSFYE